MFRPICAVPVFAATEYFASQNASVTVVECDCELIRCFETYLLPQFPNRDKIRIILADAFDYAAHQVPVQKPDHVFADIWHDPSDCVEAYLRLKLTEGLSPESEFAYWIEPTLRYYL